MEWLPTALTGERVVVRTPAAGDEPALVEMAIDAQVRRHIGGPVDHATAVTRAAQKISATRDGASWSSSTVSPAWWPAAEAWPANEVPEKSPTSYDPNGGGKG